MTMTYCHSCGRDVHITHDDDECDGTDDKPNVDTPRSCIPDDY